MIEVKPFARIIYPTDKEDGINILKKCEYAARNCYNSQAQMTELSYLKILPALISKGHTSPLEHSVMIAEIITDRAVMCELTRHRHSSFSIRSQRYVDESKTGNISFVMPIFDKYDEEKAKVLLSLWRDDCVESERRYKRMREAGAATEDARKSLNNSVATQIIMSGNLRQWREVFKLRTTSNVYPECRRVMTILLGQAK